MFNKLCAVCAKYNECTWMQIKALNSPIVDLKSIIGSGYWTRTCCKYFVYDSTKEEPRVNDEV